MFATYFHVSCNSPVRACKIVAAVIVFCCTWNQRSTQNCFASYSDNGDKFLIKIIANDMQFLSAILQLAHLYLRHGCCCCWRCGRLCVPAEDGGGQCAEMAKSLTGALRARCATPNSITFTRLLSRDSMTHRSDYQYLVGEASKWANDTPRDLGACYGLVSSTIK